MEQYLQRERERFEEFARENRDGERDEALLDGDEPDLLENPIVEHYEYDPDAFFRLCGFDIGYFWRLFDVIGAQITVPTRGRKPVIGAKDNSFLFLHWPRSANPIDQITTHFDLRSPTLYKHLHKLTLAVHGPLITKYITDLREQPLRVTGSDYRSYGLVVDATVQKRGRSVASFEEARRYFSGKHWIYCLKSQVITNRQGLALHVVAGVPGSVHDLALFRSIVTELEELVASKPNEPIKILADKGYIGCTDSQILQLITPYKKPRNSILGQAQLAANKKFGSARVIIENYFG
jgi:hypothetical protein